MCEFDGHFDRRCCCCCFLRSVRKKTTTTTHRQADKQAGSQQAGRQQKSGSDGSAALTTTARANCAHLQLLLLPSSDRTDDWQPCELPSSPMRRYCALKPVSAQELAAAAAAGFSRNPARTTDSLEQLAVVASSHCLQLQTSEAVCPSALPATAAAASDDWLTACLLAPCDCGGACLRASLWRAAGGGDRALPALGHSFVDRPTVAERERTAVAAAAAAAVTPSILCTELRCAETVLSFDSHGCAQNC